mmetsp:Transcript_26650/g.74499  ORF Transcript_26650/g.74499 Transcript_26650/m.74499 type:complete len:278 (+) Transcript_26650:37-870(+)
MVGRASRLSRGLEPPRQQFRGVESPQGEEPVRQKRPTLIHCLMGAALGLNSSHWVARKSKNSGPASALSCSPASVPILRASSSVKAPPRVVSKIWEPSTAATRPLKSMFPSASRAAMPAMGVRHEPSSAARKARSHTTARRVSSWLRPARNSCMASSPSRQAMPMAPWATAGSISSNDSTDVILSVRSSRRRPAYASSVQSTSPSCSLRSRLCTLPRKLTTLRCGNLASSWAWRRSEADPTTAPSGSSERDCTSRAMKASLTSSRSRLQGRMVPGGR